LRAAKRAARRAIPEPARAAADAAIITTIRQLPCFRSARRVGAFFAFDGEPDLSPLIRFDMNKELFVPVIIGNAMNFAAIGPDTALATNHFGIVEPVRPRLIDPRSLDLVLTPLVAFDGDGNRMGVGAGYYDRCFRFLLGRRHWFHPKLTGVAYAVQETETTTPAWWDVPLWGICTEDGFRQFAKTE
jgi:5-formyltetrahydrofolate cyclo-ligase